MADAPGNAKSIADGQRSAMAIASCPCALGSVRGTPQYSPTTAAQHRLQVTVAGGGGDAISLLGGESQLAAGNGLRLPQQFRQQRRGGASCGSRISSVNAPRPVSRLPRPAHSAGGADRRHQVTAALPGQGFPPAPSIRRRGEGVLR